MSTSPTHRLLDLTPENIAEYGVCGYKDGEIISHHPISNTRFGNIMKDFR